MSEFVISEFLVKPSLVIIDEVKDLYDDSNFTLKALCRNKSSFPYIKNRIKKWLPVHFKWISSYCDDIDFLRKNKNKIDYSQLSKNPNVNYITDLMEEHIDELDWDELSKNPSAYKILSKYPEFINWWYLCQNTSMEVMNMLETLYMDRVQWLPLSANPSAIGILKKNLSKVDKPALNINTKAIEILKEYPELIDYKSLCSNQSKEAMEIIEKNIKRDDISYELLSANKYAIPLLMKNPDKIDWYMAIDNEEIGQLLTAFRDNTDRDKIIMRYVIKYPSIIPLLKENSYNISLVKLAENPAIFKVDTNNYNLKKNAFKKMITKFV